MKRVSPSQEMQDSLLRIAIVGPCGAGKTTLAANLQRLNFRARQISQEHSHVPEMWKKIAQPDLLIYLGVSYDEATHRKNLNWHVSDLEEQISRLKHARQNCDIYILTDPLTSDQVLEEVLANLPVGHALIDKV